MSTPNHQVAIVGGGIAGLYTAWRLTVDTRTFQSGDVALYEASSRWGGRLFTWHLTDFDASLSQDRYVRAELGGMRIATTHTFVGSLANHLGIAFAGFPADVDSNYHYLRNGFMTGATLGGQTPEGPLYRLAANESGQTPSAIVFNALTGGTSPLVNTGMLPSDSTSLRQFVEYCLNLWVPNEAAGNSSPLYNFGFWNVVVNSGAVSANTNTISNEAYSFYREAYAYDTIPANWNAAVAVSEVLADFGQPAPTYYALAEGYQALPLTLQGLLDPDMLHANTAVTAISYDGTSFRLYGNDGAVLSTAEKLVLALPPRALHMIFRNPQSTLQGIDPVDFLDLLAQSSPIPLLKIFLVYAGTDWWTQAVTPHGSTDPAWPAFTRMTTDMPMRQIYNFGFAPEQSGQSDQSDGSEPSEVSAEPSEVSEKSDESEQPEESEESEESEEPEESEESEESRPSRPSGQACQLFQASYSDALNAGYWAGLMPACDQADGAPDVSTDPFGRVVPGQGGETIANGLISFNMDQNYLDFPLFNFMHNQFVNLVTQVGAQQSPPVSIQPTPPIAGAAMNWATDPFGGGVNFWNVGVNINSAYWTMLWPFTGQNQRPYTPLYIVGEGYSLLQGWVEGPLWSVEDMFRLTGLCPMAPGWLNPNATTFTPATVLPDPAAYGLPPG